MLYTLARLDHSSLCIKQAHHCFLIFYKNIATYVHLLRMFLQLTIIQVNRVYLQYQTQTTVALFLFLLILANPF